MIPVPTVKLSLSASCLSALLLVAAPVRAEPTGTATISLQSLLEMQRGNESVETPPPVAGVLESVAIAGRVLDDTLEVDVTVSASVLSSGWTQIPLLDLGKDAQIAPIAPLEGAWVVLEGGTLMLVSDKQGRHSFTVNATLPATRRGEQREVSLLTKPATSNRLLLGYDPGQVSITSSQIASAGAEGLSLRPVDGRYLVSWVPTEQGRAETAPVAIQQRVAEPLVERATASVVSTLEGTWLLRTHFDLRFEGRQTLLLTWPEDQRVERVYLNGSPAEITVNEGQLSIEITPARGGGDRGVLEVVSTRDRGGYLLRGTVDLTLPSASWPVREWICALHLPEVFDYSWTGGSLVAAESPAPDASLFTYQVPTPGRTSIWRQQLVFERAPDLRLGYTVQLEGAYFRPNAPMSRRSESMP